MNQYALIAEPDPVLASMYASVVREDGVAAVIVRDGLAASAALHERGAPVLLITELALPRVDGFDLVERLRRTPNGAKTSVVAVSASRELRENATNCRASLNIGAILARAATEESVRRVIKRLLGGGAVADKAVFARPPANDADLRAESEPIPEESGFRLRGNLRALTDAASRAVQKISRSRA